MNLTIGSLFTGYGGLDMAIGSVLDAHTVWVSDIDPGACKIIAHRYPDVPNLGDITAIDWADVEPVDIITGGYPCQPFSTAGLRAGTDDARHLWPVVADAVRHLRPRLVFLENVAGHRSMGFDRVLGDLAAIGYDAEWISLRASDVGAPHHRERLFITAHPEGRGRAQGEPSRLALKSKTDRHRLRGASGSLDSSLRRWAAVVGGPHPEPLRFGSFAGNAANPRFWEWMMGLPAGWITEVPGLTHAEQIKAAGNGVVPQQAAAALTHLLDLQAAA